MLRKKNRPKRHKTDLLSFHPHTKYSIPMASFFFATGASPKKTMWTFLAGLCITNFTKQKNHDSRPSWSQTFWSILWLPPEPIQLRGGSSTDLFSQGKSLGGFTGEDQSLQDGFGYRVFPVIRHGNIFLSCYFNLNNNEYFEFFPRHNNIRLWLSTISFGNMHTKKCINKLQH